MNIARATLHHRPVRSVVFLHALAVERSHVQQQCGQWERDSQHNQWVQLERGQRRRFVDYCHLGQQQYRQWNGHLLDNGETPGTSGRTANMNIG